MDFSTVLRFFKEHDRKKFESIIPKGTGYNVAHIPHEILTRGQKNAHINTARLEDFFTTAARIQASVTDPVFRTLMEGCVHYICDGSHETGIRHPHHFCEEYTRRVREGDERQPLRPVGMGAPAVPPSPSSSAPSAAPYAQVPPPAPAPSAEEAQLRKQVTEAVAENVRLREQMARADEIARQSIAEAHGNLKASEQKLQGTEEELRKTKASLQAEQERAAQRENLLREETVTLLQQIEAQKQKCVELERISQEKLLRMEGTIATLTQQQLQKDEDSKKRIEALTAQFSVALGEQKTALEANLAAEREKADQEAQASRAQIESMREEINAERMRFEELSGISTTLTQRLQDAKVKVTSLEELCRAKDVTIEEKVAQNKELNERLAQTISTSDKKLKSADKRAASIQEHYNKIEREYLEIKASNKALVEQLSKARDELFNAKLDANTLRGQYASLERTHGKQIKELEAQLLIAQQREEEAEKITKESQARENGMKQICGAACERATQEKALLLAQIHQLQRYLDVAKDEISGANKKIETKEAEVALLEERLKKSQIEADKIPQMTRRLADAEQRREVCLQRALQGDIAISRFRLETEAAKKMNEGLKAAIKDLERRLALSNQNVFQLRQQLQTARAARQDAEWETGRVREETKEEREYIATMEQRLQSAIEMAEGFERILALKNQELEALKK